MLFVSTEERGLMSEPKPTLSKSQGYTICFMVILSLICATILSLLASALKEPQEQAKELDRSKQMLIAARILSPYLYFQIQDDQGKDVPAKYTSSGLLEKTTEYIYPSQEEILEVYRARIEPFLVDEKGNETSFKKEHIQEKEYIKEYRKSGYYRQPFKLIYKIYANSGEKDRKIAGYVIPVNGMGLWDAIYGYLAIKPNGDDVIGISWYDQKETPGLGANISEPEWQGQFPGKLIFQESPDGKTDFATAPLGIVVVKGKVNEVLGNSPKSRSAVDGMAGATLTGNGVTTAYQEVLSAYRPFLMALHEQSEK